MFLDEAVKDPAGEPAEGAAPRRQLPEWRAASPRRRRLSRRLPTRRNEQREDRERAMIFRPFYYFDTGCAAYVFGCQHRRQVRGRRPAGTRTSKRTPQLRRVRGWRSRVIDTRPRTDHRSGGPKRRRHHRCKFFSVGAARGAPALEPLDDEQTIELGNTISACSTPRAHAGEHPHCWSAISAAAEPWFLLTGRHDVRQRRQPLHLTARRRHAHEASGRSSRLPRRSRSAPALLRVDVQRGDRRSSAGGDARVRKQLEPRSSPWTA